MCYFLCVCGRERGGGERIIQRVGMNYKTDDYGFVMGLAWGKWYSYRITGHKGRERVVYDNSRDERLQWLQL